MAAVRTAFRQVLAMGGLLGATVSLVACAGGGSQLSTDAAVFLSHTVPATLEPRQIVQVEVAVRNSGTSAWDGSFRLEGVGPDGNRDGQRLMNGSDPTVVIHPNENGVALPTGASVPAGGEYTFHFAIQAPDELVTLTPAWRMTHVGSGPFGATLTTSVRTQAVQYAENPFVFTVDQGVPGGDEGGGVMLHDLDNDGRMDYLVTSWREVAAYDHYGHRMWITTPGIRQESFPPYPDDRWQSLGGAHTPGVMAGDFFGDGHQEIGYVIRGGWLRILDGATGVEIKRYDVGQAGIALVANLRGLGDRDAVLQEGKTKLRAIRLDTGETLWTTDQFRGIDKRPARQADLDGDGRDEFVGSNIIGPDGNVVNKWDLIRDRPGFNWYDVDSIAIGDMIPGGKLEVALAEQGGNNEVIAFDEDRIIFGTFNAKNRCCEITNGKECIEIDPDKMAMGKFTSGTNLDLFAPSACGRAPWVLDSSGRIIASWLVDDTRPRDWTWHGIEDIFTIDWFGNGLQSLLVKERMVDDGHAAIVDALTGEFQRVFPTKAIRVYAADVSGDYREEAIILESPGNAPRFPDGSGPYPALQEGPTVMKVYWNEAPAPVQRPGYWTRQYYRRQKQNWNHYST